VKAVPQLPGLERAGFRLAWSGVVGGAAWSGVVWGAGCVVFYVVSGA